MHFFPYPDRTRSWIGVYMKNIFKWKKYSFRVIIHFNSLHPLPSLYLSGLYVSILQSKPFVVFFNLKVVTHGLKNYFCQQLLLWCSLRKTNHTQTNTNQHKPPFLLLCWICSIHRSASSCLLRPSMIIIINISNEVWSIFGSIFRINDRICTWVKRM